MAARRPTHRRSSSASTIPVTAAAAAPSQPAPAQPPAPAKQQQRRNSLSGGALAGVVAMVDVRVGPEAQIDCSGVVAGKMAELGAAIVKRFTPRVTHIVLSHLTDAWKDKIAKWQANISVGLARRVDGRPELQVVTQLWVNACYVSKTRMAEKPFFPVSKAAAAAGGSGGGSDSGHLHLNGAMRQFVLNNPPPPPPVVTPRSAFAGYSTGTGKSSSASKVDSGSSTETTTATATSSGSKTAGGSTGPATVNRRQTLDSKVTSATSNDRKPGSASASATATTNGHTEAPAPAAPAPLSRKAVIQFQFGAAAALAAATLGANALKRKRRALSMEPMASDAIQKLLTPSVNPVTPRRQVCRYARRGERVCSVRVWLTLGCRVVQAETATADGGAKKMLDLDAVLTPVSVETAAAKRRALMSSAKRRKTMSEMPSATLSMPVLAATDPNPQKKLSFQDDTTDCVAESQSDSEEKEATQKPHLPVATSAADETASNRDPDATPSSTTHLLTEATAAAVTIPDKETTASDAHAAHDATPADTAKSATQPSSTDRLSQPAATTIATVAVTTPVIATTALKVKPAGEFHVGVPGNPVPGNPVRLTRNTRAAALKQSQAPVTAAATVPVAPGVWKCSACGCSNTRARRLCKDCRAPRSTAAVGVAVATAKEAPAAAVRATRKLVTAPEPATPPTPVRKRKVVPANISSPPATTKSGVFTQRILATPRTITKPAAPASKRQRVAGSGSSSSTATTTTAARKLPLAPPRTPARPPSQSTVQPASAQKQQQPKEAARSLSVLEMTPVRVTESHGSKHSVSTSSTDSVTRSRNSSIASATDGKVGTDQLERIVTPQRLSSSSRRSTKSVENTPTRTPTKTPRAEKAGVASVARAVRSVIGITGVDLETRGVIECAVHAIDSSMVSEPGYRKARVVKSVDYSAAVTHLIVGEDTKRTIKVLFAIARGAWIVSEAWVFSSLEREQWQPEEDFELAMHSNKFARMHPERRQIFKAMKFFVGSSVEPSREVVQSLLQCAGGEVRVC